MDSLSSMDVLGLIAGTLTTIAFVPQLIKVCKGHLILNVHSIYYWNSLMGNLWLGNTFSTSNPI